MIKQQFFLLYYHLLLMEPQHVDQNYRQNKYQFCYNQNNPYSLTITKHPTLIYDNLYKQGTYIWITKNINQLKYKPQQIEQRAGLKINFFTSLEYVKKQYQHQKAIVIISHVSLLKQIETVLQQMFLNAKILCTVFYGYDKKRKMQLKYNFINISYLHSQQAVIQELKENKKYYATGNFVNFISLNKQKFDSNILVKTMFAMLKQKTNVQQIMQQFKYLALLSNEEYKPDIQQLIQQYSENDHLDDNKALCWYTKQTFLYRLVNRILRIQKDPSSLFIIQPFFRDLFNNVRKLYHQQQQKGVQTQGYYSKNYKKFTCYRGAQISENQINFFKQNIGLFIQNLGFMSTSRDYNQARAFSTNAIFEIIVDDDQRNTQLDYGFADVNEYICHNEEQILFNPLNSFKIIDFRYDKPEYQRYKVILQYGEMARVTKCENSKLRQKQLNLKWLGQHQIRESYKFNSLGDVLMSDYNLEVSELYWEKFMQIARISNKYDELEYAHQSKGLIAFKKGDYKKMEIQFMKCLKIYENLLKQNKDFYSRKYIQQKIETKLNNLGTSFNQLGEYEKAVQYYQRCEKISRQTLGENHPNQATTLNNLGTSFMYMGHYEKAVEYYQRCEKLRRQTLGQNHPDYGTTLNNLGVCFQKRGDYERAVEYHCRCEKIRRQTLGQNHPDYSTTLNNLGVCFEKLEQYEKAVECFQRCEKIRRQTLGVNHPEYANTLNNLGSSFDSLGQYEKAVEYYQRCEKISRQTLGEHHPNYATTLNNLASVFNKMHQYGKALQYLQICEKLEREILGENHPSYARILNNLGMTLMNFEQYEKAVEYYKRCEKIQIQKLGENHPDYAISLNNLGVCYEKLGFYEKAIYYFKKFLVIQQQTLSQKSYAEQSIGVHKPGDEIFPKIKKNNFQDKLFDFSFYNQMIKFIESADIGLQTDEQRQKRLNGKTYVKSIF